MKAIIEAKEYKRLIENTKKFTTPYGAEKMQYIHLRFIDGEVRAAALDGYRISVEYATYTGDNFNCYVKTNMPKITGVKNITVELVDNKVLITANDDLIGCKQPEGEYYDIDKFIDDYSAKPEIGVIGANSQFLIDALSAIKGQSIKDKCAKLEIRGEMDPIIIRSGEKNIKLILPVNINV